ncbi:MAG: hypothetical protein E7339_06920 [Clostridiales bacterium]|nr:hypothetical protein [Clostridiales bacterium]
MIPGLFIITILASSVITIFYKNHIRDASSRWDAFWLFLGLGAPLALVYGVICAITGFTFDLPTVLTALVAAICHVACVMALLQSLKLGSFSISIIIINMNFCIPIICSAIFLKEKVSLLQIIGIVLLIALIVFINCEKKEKTSNNNEETKEIFNDNGKQSALKWVEKNSYLIYALIACITNGLINFLIKTQQFFTPGSSSGNTFYFILYATEAVVALMVIIASLLIKKCKKNKVQLKGNLFLNGLYLGICFAICMYPQTKLAQLVAAPVQFTITAAGAVLFSIAIACVKYKEKFTIKHLISTICCITAICLQVIF